MALQNFDYLKSDEEPDDPGSRIGHELNGLVYGACGNLTDEQILRLVAIEICRELGLPLAPCDSADPAFSDVNEAVKPGDATLTVEQAAALMVGMWICKDRYASELEERNRHDLGMFRWEDATEAKKRRAGIARELRKYFRIVRDEPSE
jgi:hypothetical protein